MRTTLALLVLTFFSTTTPTIRSNGEMLLPAQQRRTHRSSTSQQQLPFACMAEDFSRQHTASGMSNGTQQPALLTGRTAKQYPCRGIRRITTANVQQAASEFLDQNQEVIGVRTENLKLLRVTEANGRWYVSYRQVYKGLDVLFSEVELRLFENGNVMALGADVYNDLELGTTPRVSPAAAREASIRGLAFDPARDRATTDGNLSVLPVREGSTVVSSGLYCRRRDREPGGQLRIVCGRPHGGMLWRYSKVRNVEVRGRATGAVTSTLPLDVPTVKDFSEAFARSGERVFLPMRTACSRGTYRSRPEWRQNSGDPGPTRRKTTRDGG